MEYRRVVLGIGNPGAEYEGTRHNAGSMALDHFAKRAGISFRRLERRAPDGARLFSGRVKARVAELPSAGGVLLVKPQTYVNLSGDVAGPLLRAAELTPDMLFVVVDDLNLSLGRLRVRPAGSAGGHNGLESIENAVGTPEYPRLRLGIGQPRESAATDYVLARFLPEERKVLDEVLERSAEIIREWVNGVPAEELMGRHNSFCVDGPGDCER